MSATGSPIEQKLPERTATIGSTMTRRTSGSDDEAIPDSDSNETTNLLLERLRAWKHMCGYLEDYVSSTAKFSKSQAKDFEKVLKTVNEPLREGHHFSQSVGGVASWFENIRSNTQGMVNLYLDSEKNLKGSVLPTLERLHKEIKAKSKELQGGAAKGAKAVDKARGVTQKHIELLAQHTATLDAAHGNKIDTAHDPYILRRGVVHRLNKQVIEENNNRQDIIAVQNNFQQFEAHVLQTVQSAMEQFTIYMSNQLDRHRAMYSDILSNAQRVPPDFEWVNFMTRNDHILVNPDAPPRSLSNITFPNQDHRATKPLIEGLLERKSRAMLKGYSSGYYVVTPARYLHEFKDNDDLRKDPHPELSLYLPDCVIGAIDGVKFNVKGKDVSGGKVGNAFHTNTELSFKATNPNEAEKWWTIIKDATRGPMHTSSSTATSPTTPAAIDTNQPPAYAEKEAASAGGVSQAQTPVTPASAAPTSAAPAGITRTDTSGTGTLPTTANPTTATASGAQVPSPIVEKTA
ncbi:PH domain protein [Aspergillus saccharolyticus JOP 1030-1]|uniref:PH domain protein n=1 Tax=Aspergillus saccharolyticus JOP 1030-1 TaxID=1450539 RepID=A0A318ZEG3_9EURO|nr:PH domain protein [Aspergillus saccharolyticus JOP 1030-1]PYH45047.1 PH domain protein [Aspergillus saccharolyticus JOP 1030-1]